MDLARRISVALPCVLLLACGPAIEAGDARVTGEKAHPTSANGLCGSQQFQLERVQPNVFLVIDRSGSMTLPIAPSSATRKWDDLKAAMSKLLLQFNNQMRFGMSLFSRTASCDPGEIDAPLATLNGWTILNQLEGATPGGTTPTAATLDYVRKHAGLDDPTRPNVVLLATDGKPNCGDTDVVGKIQALYDATPSVRTFVIGIGEETSSAPALLDSWAVAGHTERSGDVKYYQSNSAAELSDAFQTIVGGLAPCTFALPSAPPDPNKLYLSLAGAWLPNDPMNGYSYAYVDGPPSVTLNGQACEQLRADPSQKVQLVFGCPNGPDVL